MTQEIFKDLFLLTGAHRYLFIYIHSAEQGTMKIHAVTKGLFKAYTHIKDDAVEAMCGIQKW